MHPRINFGILAFCILTSTVLAAGKEVKVEASQAIKLAIIDPERRAAGRDVFHQAFADTLGFELSQRVNGLVPVKSATPDIDKASWGLGNGIYDVVLVVGNSLPRAVISADFQILKATPASGDGRFFLFFVIRKEDPSLARLLEEAFPEALKGQFFLRALARQQGVETEQWKVALASAR